MRISKSKLRKIHKEPKTLIIDHSMYAAGLIGFLRKVDGYQDMVIDTESNLSRVEVIDLTMYSTIFIDACMYRELAESSKIWANPLFLEKRKIILTCIAMCESDVFKLNEWRIQGMIPKSISCEKLKEIMASIDHQSKFIDFNLLFNQIRTEQRFFKEKKVDTIHYNINSEVIIIEDVRRELVV